jgi:predicted RecA/RadA family phage recombinase
MQGLAPLLAARTAIVTATDPLPWHVGTAGDETQYGLWRTPAEDRDVDQSVFRRGTVVYTEEFDLYAKTDGTMTAVEAAYAVYAAFVAAVDGVTLPLGADATGKALTAMRGSVTLINLSEDPAEPAYGHAVVFYEARIRSA